MGFFGQYFWFFLAIAAMLALQLYGAARQSKTFMTEVGRLRAKGNVAIGLGGQKLFGRKAYVALAVRDGRVVEALVLRGLTQFAKAKPAPHLVGATVRKLSGSDAVPGADRIEREAARQAAKVLSTSGGWQPTGGAIGGKESAQPA